MDISNFDLKGLQIIHNSLKSVLKNHENRLKELVVGDNRNEIIEKAIQYKIEGLKISIAKIENKIIELNKEKLRFSKEYVFWNFGLTKKSFQVHFLTTSKAYNKYGNYVTGIALFLDNEIPELIEASKKGDWTDGVIRFEANVNNKLTKNQIKELETVGFMASEIDSIEFA